MHEKQLQVLWPPPQKRKRPPSPQRGASFDFIGNYNQSVDTTDTEQRAIQHAARRVAQLEHQAKILSVIGCRDAALRLAALADTIRAEVLE
jgi:hypothetical protein